jgi:hypothetical protein
LASDKITSIFDTPKLQNEYTIDMCIENLEGKKEEEWTSEFQSENSMKRWKLNIY